MRNYPTWVRNKEYNIETRIKIANSNGSNEVTYGQNKIFSISINNQLFDGDMLTIGSCVSGEITCELYLHTNDVPKMARLIPQIILKASGESDYVLNMGVYYVDTRKYNTKSGILTLSGYDAMLKLAQPFITDGTEYTFPLKVWDNTNGVINDILTRVPSITLESATRTLLSSIGGNLEVPYTNDMTMREVLGMIACFPEFCGNWTINFDGELEFIPLGTATSYSVVQAESFELQETVNKINKVILNSSNDSGETFTYTAEDTEIENGRELSLDFPWGTDTMASALLNKLKTINYIPYDATGVLVKPYLEMCDGVRIDDENVIIYSYDLSLGQILYADLSAPSDGEVEHEYPYESTSRSVTAEELKQAQTHFTVQQGLISAEVTRLGEDKLDVSATPEQVRIQFSKVRGIAKESVTDPETGKPLEEYSVAAVDTGTGFKFDDSGLTISKNGVLSTNIDEDGMVVFTGGEKPEDSEDESVVLKAESSGVNALNLTARQYLKVCGNIRFEKLQNNRMACFWTGE